MFFLLVLLRPCNFSYSSTAVRALVSFVFCLISEFLSFFLFSVVLVFLVGGFAAAESTIAGIYT